MKPSRLSADDVAELRRVEAECLRAEVLELLLCLLRRQEPDAGPLPLCVLRENELRAACELERECRGLRAALARTQRLQPAGGHQVHEQDELAVAGGEEEPLAAALHATELSAFQCLQRRVE